ncbi:hypothetical protein RND71_019073 [Anisodus tanguticus]|uniref:Uncharacterized protein n=1 Tax=Anisodus tanguticus TaxID=243964 RepID=A0AAE1VCM1_9SOLA|nr:hypothetical protein RND71_019073 [Anisodus tanguticus]
MAGTTVNSMPATGVNVGANMLNPSYVNSFRISAVADRLATHVCNQPTVNAQEFVHLCLSLARGIDFAIANQEVPNRAQDLPQLVKQVIPGHWSALWDNFGKMRVLLASSITNIASDVSAFNASQSGWFTEKDAEELCNLANEVDKSAGLLHGLPVSLLVIDVKLILSSFSVCMYRFPAASAAHLVLKLNQAVLSQLSRRFYPRLKMGRIISFLEVKPGFGAFVNDFQITKNMNLSEGEKVRLFVAQTDILETSLCLITPPQVNFLLNGTPVGRRTNVLTDPGPQLPSPVPHMLKFGTNLLQAVGQFNGNYIIAVAFMSEISTPVQATLPDYEQAPVSSVDPDSEIIEGPSRISLNCPISFILDDDSKRCKFLCSSLFSFHPLLLSKLKMTLLFVLSSVTRWLPSWYRQLLEVLKEVSEDVTDVMISSDGSWKEIMESDDHTEKPRDKTPDIAQDSPHRGSGGPSNAPGDYLDLTDIDDEMNPVTTAETEDRKNFPTISQIQSDVQNTTAVNNPSEINQTGAVDMGDDFWSRIYLSSCGIGTSSSLSSMQSGSVSEPARTNLMQAPVLIDNPEGNAFIPTSILENGLSSSNLLQLQQFQYGYSAISNEYGRFPSAARQANRTVAVQALPAQMNTPVPQQRQQSARTPLLHAGPPAATQDLRTVSLDGSNLRIDLERHSFSDLDLLQACMTSSALPLKRPLAPLQPSQQVVGRQAPHLRTPYSTSQSQATWDRWETLKNSSQVGVTRGFTGGQHARVVATQQTTQAPPVHSPRTAPPPDHPPRTVPLPVHSPRTTHPVPDSADRFRTPLAPDQRGSTGGVTPVTSTDSSVDPQLDPNWRPTGRMRGSLSGRAYSEALQQFILKPTQQAQAARPSILPNLSPQLQVLLANRGAHSTPPVNYPSTAPAKASDISGVLPEHSSGMQ